MKRMAAGVVVTACLVAAGVASASQAPWWLDRPLEPEQLRLLFNWPANGIHNRLELQAWAKALMGELMATMPSAPVLDPSTAFNWIPTNIGDVPINGSPLAWQSPCFGEASAQLVGGSLPTSGIPSIAISTNDPSAACQEEIYLLTTPNALLFHILREPGVSVINWTSPIAPNERVWLGNNGFRIMRLVGTMEENLESLVATLGLFVPELTQPVWSSVAEYNAAFLRSKAYYTLEHRNVTDVIPDASQIQDGDFFGILRLDGLDPMLGWAMGAHTGHTTIALRFDGELYICESTDKGSYWPTPGIQRTPYNQWIAQAKAASFNVVHLPLTAEARARFNATAAGIWFRTVAEGLPYGYHNMLFSWVDTPNANYPGTLSAPIHEILVGIVDRVSNRTADLMWNLAFNKRLQTQGLRTVDVYNLAHQRNLSFAGLFELPEQDAWVYPNGYSMVCDVLVCETWKAGGLFGDLANSIQCTEFTNWDAYTLAIFDTSTPRPAACVAADPTLPYCQILGEYRMTLPSYNTRVPYAHMAERCPRGQPPTWDKPAGC